MLQDTHKTDVMFRVDTTKDFKGTVFAVLPHNVETIFGDIATYQHVGQHSIGNYQTCLTQSRPANELESADLKAEMESLGYNIKVVKKQTHKKFVSAWKEVCK